MATVTFQHSSTPAPKNPFPPVVLGVIIKNVSFLLNVKGHQVTHPIELFKTLVHVQCVRVLFFFKIPGTKHLVVAFGIID